MSSRWSWPPEPLPQTSRDVYAWSLLWTFKLLTIPLLGILLESQEMELFGFPAAGVRLFGKILVGGGLGMVLLAAMPRSIAGYRMFSEGVMHRRLQKLWLQNPGRRVALMFVFGATVHLLLG